MCAVSYVGDMYTKKWTPRIDIDYQDWINDLNSTGPSRSEFEALKREVLEMKELLKLAKFYDDHTNQPDCEMEDKVSLLKKVAKMVGVSLEDIFK